MRILFVIDCIVMYEGMGVVIFVKIGMENRVSGIFPETTWRVARDRQATHAPEPCSRYQR